MEMHFIICKGLASKKTRLFIHEHDYLLVSSVFYRMPTLPSLLPNMRKP